MRLNQDDHGQLFVVRGFSENHVTVNDEQLNHAFLLTPEQKQTPPISRFDALDATAADWLLTDKPEVIIVATGNQTRMGEARLAATLMQQGIGIEYMDIGAACRTYTVLASEHRRVSLLVLFEHGQ
ncbi:MAG TPA: hypothetical protein ENM98_02120 [Halothiobacillaceae bacterium]|nr:hypothetical protein [Halothiobacillaceae bacterium]